MEKHEEFVSLALVILTLLAVAAPALALSGSYSPYLGGTGSSSYIRRRHTGDQVKNLQMLLNAVLYTSLEIDGVFGSGTEDAVERFQQIIWELPWLMALLVLRPNRSFGRSARFGLT